MRLLVVEDDRVDRIAVRRALAGGLAGRDVQVVESCHVVSGLEALASQAFDCALVDYFLPDGTALDFIASAERLGIALPAVVVLTGHDDESTALATLGQGAQEYLIKGAFDARVLGRAITHSIERRRLETKVERLAAQYEGLLDAAGEGIFGLDGDGVCTFANRQALRMLGAQASDLVGKPLCQVTKCSCAAPSGGCKAQACRLIGLVAGTRTHTQEERFHRKDGTVIPVELTAAPVLDEAGRPGAVVTFRDVSARLEAQRVKDEFLSVVSHELRNPAAALVTILDTLTNGYAGNLTEQARTLASLAAGTARRLVRLTDDLLDSEGLRLGRTRLEMSQTSLAALVADAVAIAEPVAAGRGIAVRSEAPDVGVRVDPDALIQVFFNLIVNAVQHSPDGAEIRVEAKVEGEWLAAEVHDTGSGIPEERLPTIFSPFSGGSRVRGGGRGLGLSIVKGLVEGHGGEVWVSSREGVGSTFGFRMPVVRPCP